MRAAAPDRSSETVLGELDAHTRKIALSLGVVGLINVQYAVKDDEVFVLEANPRAVGRFPSSPRRPGVALAQWRCT